MRGQSTMGHLLAGVNAVSETLSKLVQPNPPENNMENDNVSTPLRKLNVKRASEKINATPSTNKQKNSLNPKRDAHNLAYKLNVATYLVSGQTRTGRFVHQRVLAWIHAEPRVQYRSAARP